VQNQAGSKPAKCASCGLGLAPNSKNSSAAVGGKKKEESAKKSCHLLSDKFRGKGGFRRKRGEGQTSLHKDHLRSIPAIWKGHEKLFQEAEQATGFSKKGETS